MCAATTRNGTPCKAKALPFTINGTCRRHHRAVRTWAAKHGYGKLTPWGIVDTWGAPPVTYIRVKDNWGAPLI